MSNKRLASVPAIKQYLKSADAAGVDYIPLLAEAGIPLSRLDDNNNRIDGDAMERLIVLLANASGDPCLGLNAASFVEPASYSVLGYISMNCSTLREVLARIPIYEKIVGDMGVSSTVPMEGKVLQRWECQFTDPVARRHEVDTVLGSWFTYAREFLHVTDSLAEAIWFEHAPPDSPDACKTYENFFNCELLFEQSANGILIPESELDVPLPQANEQLLHTLLDYATEIVVEFDGKRSVTDQVKDLLRLMLRESPPSSELIAEKLGMSARTLQRKLHEEGTHYKEVLNDLRLELALHYLKNTQLSLDSIAGKLGYAEPRSFYRSFKQWTGGTAGSYRN